MPDIAHTGVMRPKFAVIATLVLAAALGAGVAVLTTHPKASTHSLASDARSRTSVTFNSAPTLDDTPQLYFATPEAAMRYLAAAWNRNDKIALWHVTTPDGRAALENIRSEAENLQLTMCTKNPTGDYTCDFTHDYPPSMHKHGTDTATFTAAPAREHGWYMTYFEGCG